MWGSSLLLLGSLLGGLGNLAGLAIGLLDRLDDTDGNGLPHVSDGESTKRRVLVVRLDAHRLGGDKLDNGGITRLDELGGGLHDLTGSSVDLLDDGVELALWAGSNRQQTQRRQRTASACVPSTGGQATHIATPTQHHNTTPLHTTPQDHNKNSTLTAMWAVWQSRTGE